jgi:hypothetical protein
LTNTPTPEFTAPAPPPEGVTDLLARVTVVDSMPQLPGYERSCSPGKGCVFGPAWKDVDRTGCDTRNRVLAAQLRDPAFKAGTHQCKVVSGTLDDPYSGTELIFGGPGNADIEIDHVFALARAWDAGAANWPAEDRVRFANDLDNLLATTGTLNASKGDSGPGSWLPPNEAFACIYALKYLQIAAKYGLVVTKDDGAAAQQACTQPPA